MTVRLTGALLVAAMLTVIAGCSGGGPMAPSPDGMTVDGRITDAISGEGVPGVGISIGDQSTVTDADGYYSLYNVDPGQRTMTVTPPAGYDLAGPVGEISIEEGGMNLDGIFLTPETEQPPAPPAPSEDA